MPIQFPNPTHRTIPADVEMTAPASRPHAAAPLLCLLVAGLLAFHSCGPGGTSGTPGTPPPSPTPPPAPEPEPEPSWPKFGKFTDSQGRTIAYGLYLREDWDPSQPRGLLVYFHGNNEGPQEDFTHSWFGDDMTALFDMGLAVAFLGSPESRPPRHPATLFGWLPGGSETRRWNSPDARVVHELLQSGFDAHMSVDYNRVVFMGGSQGTEFLTNFFERYAGNYGGGYHMWCGSFWGVRALPPRSAETGSWEPTFPWTQRSTSVVRERLRVFVEATTGDFLHADAIAARDYYRDVLKLEPRFDLEGPGGHCHRGATPRVEVWAWLSGDGPNPPPPGSDRDVDGDGIRNDLDSDDDNDGALDWMDALPLDPRGHLDSDEDGIGDFADRDADGDGVENAADAFPRDPRESLDSDGDGIGNNLDADDDNDGIGDLADPDPLEGIRTDQLRFHRVEAGVGFPDFEGRSNPHGRLYPVASVHSRRPASFVYPEPTGDRQSYQYIELGSARDRTFEIMIDRLERGESCRSVLLPELCVDPPSTFAQFEHYADKIYVDTNQNGDLTDDGPPLLLARHRGDLGSLPNVTTVLQVSYGSGETLPYGIKVWSTQDLGDGIGYQSSGVWMGRLGPPQGDPVLVALVDWNLDGRFNSSGPRGNARRRLDDPRDFACVDLDRNGVLDECLRDRFENDDGTWLSPSDRVIPGETFTLDGRAVRIAVPATGHTAEILPAR